MPDEIETMEVKPEEKPTALEYDTPPKAWVPGTKVRKIADPAVLGPDGEVVVGKDEVRGPYEMDDAEYVQYCYDNRMPFWAIKRSVLERYPPVISSIEPATAAIGDDSFEMIVHGEKFFAGSVIMFAGQDEPTAFNEEDATVSTGINMGVWHGADVVPVQVRNGGNLSNVVEFTFTATEGKGAAGHAPDPDARDEAEELDERDDDGKPAKRKAKHKK